MYAQVDRYIDGLFAKGESAAALETAAAAALARSQAEGLPAIHVAPNLGRFLHVLALACGAQTILEIGTLGGYSTIWLAGALPAQGRLVTLEYEPLHADVAGRNVADAGLADRVDIRVGRALDLLGALREQGAGPFDMIFIDADKAGYPDYLRAVLDLARPGTLLVADNVVRRGAVAQGPSGDASVTGAQRFNEALAAEPRVRAAIVQSVGVKGHDGMAFAVVQR